MTIIKKTMLLVLALIVGAVAIIPNFNGNMTHAQEKKLTIVTSFYPLYAMTQEIVGDKHEVMMIDSQKGIHGFEPSAKDVATIYDADVFIYHTSTLESWTRNMKSNLASQNVTVIEAGRELTLHKVEGLDGVEEIKGMNTESMYDPHSWLDPIEAAHEANLIAAELAKIDSTHADFFLNNAQNMTEKAERIVAEYQDKFTSLQQKTFVTQHTAFSYLASRFGLTQLGISGVSSDVEPTSKQLIDIQKFVTKYQVHTIFVEPNVNDKAAKVISDGTGAKLVEMSPMEVVPNDDKGNYLDNLTAQIEILYNELKAENQ